MNSLSKHQKWFLQCRFREYENLRYCKIISKKPIQLSNFKIERPKIVSSKFLKLLKLGFKRKFSVESAIDEMIYALKIKKLKTPKISLLIDENEHKINFKT